MFCTKNGKQGECFRWKYGDKFLTCPFTLNLEFIEITLFMVIVLFENYSSVIFNK